MARTPKKAETAAEPEAEVPEVAEPQAQAEAEQAAPEEAVIEPEADEPAAPYEPSSELVAMVHPDGGDADGFDHDEDGAILVPATRVSDMISHGFTPKD